MFDDKTVFQPQRMSAVIDRDGNILLKHGLHQYCFDWFKEAYFAFKQYGMQDLMLSWTLVQDLTEAEIVQMTSTQGWIPDRIQKVLDKHPIDERYFEAIHQAQRVFLESGPKRAVLPLFDMSSHLDSQPDEG